MFKIFKSSLLLAMIGGIALSALFFVFVSKTSRYTVSIHRDESPEIGDQLTIRYPSWISEDSAKKSFSISPETTVQLIWFPDVHELIVFPELGFDPNVQYKIKISTPSPLLAAVGAFNKSYTFKVHTVTENTSPPKVYTPQVNNGKYIDINLRSMIITLFLDGKPVKTFPVAGKGKNDRSPTPEGQFKVLRKEPKHFSRLSHAWMPWSLNFRSDGYYIHGWPYFANGEKVKVSYSLGCVRLNDGNDKELYDWAEIGTPVIIHSSTQAVLYPDDTSVKNGDLVKELSDPKVYLIKISGEKKFKRHILTSDIQKWYPHLYPFTSKIKTVSDGTLSNYATSRWIKSDQDPLIIYELDDAGNKHKMICNNNSSDCLATWSLYGWDGEEIFTVNVQELEYYPEAETIQLKISPALSK